MTAVDNPGRLNRRLVLEAPVETPDGAGGVTRAYQPETSIWAEVTPLAPFNDVEAASAGATIKYRILVRAGRDITTGHRLRFGARVLRIVSVRDPDGRGRFIEIRAEERIA